MVNAISSLFVPRHAFWPTIAALVHACMHHGLTFVSYLFLCCLEGVDLWVFPRQYAS